MHHRFIFFLYIVTSLQIFSALADHDLPTKIVNIKPFYISEAQFFDVDNNRRYIEDFEDQTILLVFWASWCSSCTDSMYSLDVLAKDFRRLSFKIIALSEDFLGIQTIKTFYKNHDIRHLDIYHDYKNKLFQDMNVSGLPSAYLISPTGEATILFKGPCKWHDNKVRSLILDQIQGNPSMPKNSYKPPEININLIKHIEEPKVMDNNVVTDNLNIEAKQEINEETHPKQR